MLSPETGYMTFAHERGVKTGPGKQGRTGDIIQKPQCKMNMRPLCSKISKRFKTATEVR